MHAHAFFDCWNESSTFVGSFVLFGISRCICVRSTYWMLRNAIADSLLHLHPAASLDAHTGIKTNHIYIRGAITLYKFFGFAFEYGVIFLILFICLSRLHDNPKNVINLSLIHI